jgi:hypothetical protein
MLPLAVWSGGGGAGSSSQQPLNEDDPDDEELDETPEDVIEMLGFDPADEDGGVDLGAEADE